MRNSEGGDAEFLRSRLRRFRRRALAALFLDAAPSCLALSFAAWIAWAFLLGNGNPSLTAFALPGLLAALVSAAIRMPSLAGTARAVDRNAGLEQRLETAAELMELPADDDVVAALILRDARRAMEKLRSDVMPLRLGSGRWTGGAFAILTLVLLAAALFTRDGGLVSLRSPALVPRGGAVPEGAVRMSDSEEGPGSGGAEVTSPGEEEEEDEEDEEEEGESARTVSSSEQASPSLSASEADELSRGPDPLDTLSTRDVGSDEEEWTAIEAPLGRARDGSGGPSTAGTRDAGSSAERGASWDPGGERIEASRAASFPNDMPFPAGTHYESAPPQGGVPPGLREYVREYFSKLRKTR